MLGSLLGGLACLTLTLAGSGITPPAPLTTPRMHQVVAEQTAAQGAAAVTNQPLAGIPYKVYAAQAGRSGVDPAGFLAGSLIGRGVRIATFGALFTLIGFAGRRARRLYTPVLLIGLAGFGVGLGIVVAAWS